MGVWTINTECKALEQISAEQCGDKVWRDFLFGESFVKMSTKSTSLIQDSSVAKYCVLIAIAGDEIKNNVA